MWHTPTFKDSFLGWKDKIHEDTTQIEYSGCVQGWGEGKEGDIHIQDLFYEQW